MGKFRFSYVLPDPGSYSAWDDLKEDLSCMKECGYDAVEFQIAEPLRFNEEQVRQLLDDSGLTMCAFQTGASYATLGNCLCTADEIVRRRTLGLLHRFVDLAARWNSVIVFGSLQGRLKDEPDIKAGSDRIRRALSEVGQYASEKHAVIAFEPVNHSEVGYHNTIAEAERLVRSLNLPGVKLMVDSYHMNIEEMDMLAPLNGIADILSHVHLSETNRDILGTGHWPVPAFLSELDCLNYGGYCSIGVYNTRLPRCECIKRCMDALRLRAD